MSSADEARRPVLRVIRPDATDEEIAALVAVIAAGAGSGRDSQADAQIPTSAWSDRAAALRRTHRPGPGAWRASAWHR
jgi:Acyl-CoA carboxylase epsilon subunit